KAVEDTAFYHYGRLISGNDVGFDIRRLSSTGAEFHRAMQRRAADFPHAMLATATHDHKRGEDARARLAVLSERSREWTQAVERWISHSLQHYQKGELAPDPADLAILFQSIVGSWPLDLATDDGDALSVY